MDRIPSPDRILQGSNITFLSSLSFRVESSSSKIESVAWEGLNFPERLLHSLWLRALLGAWAHPKPLAELLALQWDAGQSLPRIFSSRLCWGSQIGLLWPPFSSHIPFLSVLSSPHGFSPQIPQHLSLPYFFSKVFLPAICLTPHQIKTAWLLRPALGFLLLNFNNSFLCFC